MSSESTVPVLDGLTGVVVASVSVLVSAFETDVASVVPFVSVVVFRDVTVACPNRGTSTVGRAAPDVCGRLVVRLPVVLAFGLRAGACACACAGLLPNGGGGVDELDPDPDGGPD